VDIEPEHGRRYLGGNPELGSAPDKAPAHTHWVHEIGCAVVVTKIEIGVAWVPDADRGVSELLGEVLTDTHSVEIDSRSSGCESCLCLCSRSILSQTKEGTK